MIPLDVNRVDAISKAKKKPSLSNDLTNVGGAAAGAGLAGNLGATTLALRHPIGSSKDKSLLRVAGKSKKLGLAGAAAAGAGMALQAGQKRYDVKKNDPFNIHKAKGSRLFARGASKVANEAPPLHARTKSGTSGSPSAKSKNPITRGLDAATGKTTLTELGGSPGAPAALRESRDGGFLLKPKTKVTSYGGAKRAQTWGGGLTREGKVIGATGGAAAVAVTQRKKQPVKKNDPFGISKGVGTWARGVKGSSASVEGGKQRVETVRSGGKILKPRHQTGNAHQGAHTTRGGGLTTGAKVGLASTGAAGVAGLTIKPKKSSVKKSATLSPFGIEH